VEAAPVPVDEAAATIGNEVAERRDTVLEGHAGRLEDLALTAPAGEATRWS
jgi:hypothetical protein